jgi:Fe-S cluster assembly protein SufD
MNTNLHWQTQFDNSIAQNANPNWLTELRHQAFKRWQTSGFPTLRNERWKYTELMPLAQTEFHLSKNTSSDHYQDLLPETIENSLRLIFVDGQLISELTSDEIYLATLVNTLKQNPAKIEPYITNKNSIDSITDLNTALATDGMVIFIPANCNFTRPIHLIYLYTQIQNNMVHMQNIVHLAEGATATIVEHHIGKDDNRYFSTSFNSIKLEKNANLTYYRWQEQGSDAYHINRTQLMQATHSNTAFFSFDLKGHLVRNEIFQEFIGENAECKLTGLYLGRGKQHIDNYITLNHAVPFCRSEQLFKGILDDRSHGVFHGKVVVSKDAQKTDAQQHNANLILSDKAEIDTQPQLEIYADDVKCTHGAAIGQLDEEALFYLESRGINADIAKQMLIYGFAADTLQHVEQSTLHAFCQTRIRHYFPEMPLLQDELK